jgi:hypothetical protein
MTDAVSPQSASVLTTQSGVGRLLLRALVLAHGSGPAVEAELEEVLAELAASPEETLEELRRFNESAGPDDVGLRWTTLYVASMLTEPNGRPWLTEVACETLPPDPTAGEACESSLDGEVLVRVMATEAIVGLLGVEEEATIEALLEVISRQPHVSIRAVAGQALVEHDPSLREPVLELLPEDQWFIVDLRRVPHTELTIDQESLPPDSETLSPGPPSPDAQTDAGAARPDAAPRIAGAGDATPGALRHDCGCEET